MWGETAQTEIDDCSGAWIETAMGLAFLREETARPLATYPLAMSISYFIGKVERSALYFT
jgi:hypothetical protein